MSHSDIRVVPGPANYYSHPGSLARLQDFYSEEQLSRAVWVYGERAIAGAQAFLPAAFNAPGAKKILFKGHCSESDVSELARASGDDRSVVIGVGGGALLDTAKALARRWWPSPPSPPPARRGRRCRCGITMPVRRCSLKSSTTPTSWCWWSRTLFLTRRRNICWRASAIRWRNGMKRWCWLRSRRRCPSPRRRVGDLGINGALAIRDVLLESSETALADQQRGELTQEFRDVVDAVIAGGGMVGGLGERYTRVAAAHAVHNGLTVLPQTEKYLHGTKVAYGILVQSALLGQDDVLAQLVQAYRRFNLPTTLAALEVDINNREQLDKVIAHTLRPVESIHFLPVELNAETLRAAFEKVERFAG